MPRYSPYGNHLGRYWPLASLTLLLLALALGSAVLFSADSDVLQLVLTAATIPAGFAVLIASNGYGMLSSHDDRFRLRQLLAVAGGLVGLAGLYLAFDAIRPLFEWEFYDEAINFFILRMTPYAAVSGLMALSIIRLSTRLRRSPGASGAMTAFGLALALVAIIASLALGFDLRETSDSLSMAMLIGATPAGFGIIVTTYSLRQGGHHRATVVSGFAGSALIAALGVAGAVWVGNLAEDAFIADLSARLDRGYLLGIHSLVPLALAALNLRIAMRQSLFPIWMSVATGAAAVAFGLWVASQPEPMSALFHISLPDVDTEVSGFGWVWLAASLTPFSIAMYAVFCIEEPWQWLWERLRARRAHTL